MRRVKRRLFNLFAFALLAFAIYLNFFYKEEQPGLLRSQPSKQAIPDSTNQGTTRSLSIIGN
jgi:hypothetical protein